VFVIGANDGRAREGFGFVRTVEQVEPDEPFFCFDERAIDDLMAAPLTPDRARVARLVEPRDRVQIAALRGLLL